MKKHLVCILMLSLSYIVNAQQLELGPLLSLSSNNISNNSSTINFKGIGNSLYSFDYGISSLLYFNDPVRKNTFGLVLKYKKANIASRSKIFSDSYIKTDAHVLSFLLRFASNKRYARKSSRAYNRGAGELIVYFDLGANLSFLNKNKFITSDKTQEEIFPDLSNSIILKKQQVAIESSLGVEKEMNKKIKAFVELNSILGITSLNENDEHLHSYNFSISLGFRFMSKSKKKACDCP